MAGFEKHSTKAIHDKKLLTAQLHIQNNLDGDLSLKAVADVIGSSPFHFHRQFKAQLGETLKQYVDRLRVEKSLMDIRISDLNLLQISLRYGYKNPETYSRAFKRHFGKPPSNFLKERGKIFTAIDSQRGEPEFEAGLRSSVDSNFTVSRLPGLHVAFIRHIGSYYDVPLIANTGPSIWRDLEAFVRANSLAREPLIYAGIPQDNPATTVPAKQRYDACLLVERPFETQGNIGYQMINEGYYGVLTHAGPYATLTDAYVRLFTASSRLKRFSVAPRPGFELLLNIEAASIDDHTWTELYLPLKQRGSLT